MERAALGLSPGLRTPPTRSRRRTPRWGQAIEHGPGTTRSTSHPLILQSVVHSQRATSCRTSTSNTLGCPRRTFAEGFRIETPSPLAPDSPLTGADRAVVDPPPKREHSAALCAVERNSRAAQSRGFVSCRSLLEVRAGLPLQRDVGVGGRLQAPASGRLSRCRSKVVIARARSLNAGSSSRRRRTRRRRPLRLVHRRAAASVDRHLISIS